MGADANSVGPDVTRAHICVNLFIISVNLQSRVDKPDTFRHLYGMWFRMNPLVGLSNVKTSLHHPVFIRSAAKAQCCSVTDHRPIPASHSTGAAVSSSPQQHHQHHPSTSSSTSANDVSSMSPDPDRHRQQPGDGGPCRRRCYSLRPNGLLQMTIAYTWFWAGPRHLVTSKTTSPTPAPRPTRCVCFPSVLVFSSVALTS